MINSIQIRTSLKDINFKKTQVLTQPTIYKACKPYSKKIQEMETRIRMNRNSKNLYKLTKNCNKISDTSNHKF